MNKIEKLNVQLFADGADKASMLEMYSKTHIKGLTTNPTLMKKAGILDYKKFSKDILKTIQTYLQQRYRGCHYIFNA